MHPDYCCLLCHEANDIGLIQPIVLNEKYKLIAGLRRLKAVKFLKWKHIPVNIVNVYDLMRGQIHENSIRKDFTLSEAIAIKREVVKKMGRPKKSCQFDNFSGKTVFLQIQA